MAFDKVLRRRNSDTQWLPLTSGLTDRHPKYYYGYRNTETGELFDSLPTAPSKPKQPARKTTKKVVIKPLSPPNLDTAEEDQLDEVLEGI